MRDKQSYEIMDHLFVNTHEISMGPEHKHLFDESNSEGHIWKQSIFTLLRSECDVNILIFFPWQSGK